MFKRYTLNLVDNRARSEARSDKILSAGSNTVAKSMEPINLFQLPVNAKRNVADRITIQHMNLPQQPVMIGSVMLC